MEPGSPVILGKFRLDIPTVDAGAGGAKPPDGAAVALAHPRERLGGEGPGGPLSATALAMDSHVVNHAQTLRHRPPATVMDEPDILKL
jgi:hypothetical protein